MWTINDAVIPSSKLSSSSSSSSSIGGGGRSGGRSSGSKKKKKVSSFLILLGLDVCAGCLHDKLPLDKLESFIDESAKKRKVSIKFFFFPLAGVQCKAEKKGILT